MSHLYTFPRKEMKARARGALAGHWKTPLLMTLIFAILVSLTAGVYYSQATIFESLQTLQQMPHMSLNEMMMHQAEIEAQSTNDTTVMLSNIIYMLMNLFMAGSYVLAMVKWYLERIQGMEVGFGDFLANFNLTLKGIGLYIWKQIWLALWMLPFLIGMTFSLIFLAMFSMTRGTEDQALFYAGVIFLVLFLLAILFVSVYKSICYLFIFQAGADAPKRIGIRRAMRISIEATNGYRGDVLILILSFIPWFILSALTLGLAGFYVIPYFNATLCEAYVFLRDGGFDTGRFDPEEFDMTMVVDEPEAMVIDRQPLDSAPVIYNEDATITEVDVPHPQGDETIYLNERVNVGDEDER